MRLGRLGKLWYQSFTLCRALKDPDGLAVGVELEMPHEVLDRTDPLLGARGESSR